MLALGGLLGRSSLAVVELNRDSGMEKTRLLLSLLLSLLVVGLVVGWGSLGVAQAETFDPSNFKDMHMVALLVTEPSAKLYDSSLGLTKKRYEMPVVWKESMFSQSIPISSGDIPIAKIGSGILSMSIIFGEWESSEKEKMVVYKNDTVQLQRKFENYDLKVRLEQSFIDKVKSIASFDYVPSDAVKEAYEKFAPDYDAIVKKARGDAVGAQEKRKAKEEALKKARESFLKNIGQELISLGADTFIVLDIQLWGFKRRGVFTRSLKKGNLFAIVGLNIIRLSDKNKVWGDIAIVDLYDDEIETTLEELFQKDQQALIETVNELADRAAESLASPLTTELVIRDTS